MSNFDTEKRTQGEALDQGLLIYTGNPCPKGHGRRRYLARNQCVGCLRDKEADAFYEKTGERLLGIYFHIHPKMAEKAADLINELNLEYRRTYDNTK